MNFPRFNRSGYILSGVALLFIISVVGFGAWATAGNKGIVQMPPDRPLKHDPDKQKLDGKYISFEYNGVYDLKKQPSTSNDVEMYYLTANANYEKHLAVDVSRLTTGGLSNYVSYTARSGRKDLYTEQALTVDGGPATEFVKNDTTERTVFVPHGDKVLVLSFVSNSILDDLQTEIDDLLNSFQWKQ